jgi:hypothetical protein
MRSKLAGLRRILVVVGMFASASAMAATPLFLVDSDAITYNTLFSVDRTTGQLTTIGSISFPEFGSVLALAAASDNLLYAVASGGAVLQIDVSPFAVTTIGSIGISSVAGLAYSQDGRLFGVDETNNLLLVIDPSPFGFTLLGMIHVGSPDGPLLTLRGGDLVQDASGAWFLWTNSTEALYRLDVTNAVAMPVASRVTSQGTKSGLAIDYEGGGALLASSGPLHALLTLDPTTGGTIASVNFCLTCPTVYKNIQGDLASPFPNGAATTTSTTSSTSPSIAQQPTTTATTSTTTLPCTTARCTLVATLISPACAGQTIPASVSGKLSTAETLIDRAATTPGKKARKVRQRAKILLRQAGANATRAAKGKKAKLSTACAAALKAAAGAAASGL